MMDPIEYRGVALAALLLAAISCTPDADPSPATRAGLAERGNDAKPRWTLLISVDTLRADHLGTYGYDRATSPVIDALGREGVVFEDVTSTAPWTLPAHASMLTGLYPSHHGATGFARAMSPHLPTLATTLSGRGYETAAVVNTTHLKPDFGVVRGFEEYRYVEESVDRVGPSTWVTDQAIEWLQERRAEPGFMFVHYYDVHASYFSLPKYEQMFTTPYDGVVDGSGKQLYSYLLDEGFAERCRRNPQAEGCRTWIADPEFATTPRIEFDDADLRRLIELYDAGVRQMDAEIGRLVDFLRREDMLDDTLLILTSDHGDEFLEHGGLLHSRDQYQELLRVPLIMRGPGVGAGVRIDTPVSLVDIVPTVLALLGEEPLAAVDGLDLSQLWQRDARSPGREGEDPFRDRPLLAEASAENLKLAVRRGRYKLHYDRVRGTQELYDLEEDPGERVDLSQREPAIAAELRELLQARPGAGSSGEVVELSPADRQRLEALGYVD